MGDFELSLVGSSSTVALSPYMTFGYNNELTRTLRTFRMRSGKLFTYKYGAGYNSFTVPCFFLFPAFAYRINTWWSEQNLLNFTEDNSITPINSGFFVRITNKNKPFAQIVESEHATSINSYRWEGTIKLETI